MLEQTSATRPTTPPPFADVLLRSEPSDGAFAALDDVAVSLRLRERLRYEAADLDRLLLAAVIEGRNYFYCPDSDRLWLNGLDEQDSLSTAFMLFDDVAAVVAFLEERQPTVSQFVAYSLRLESASIILEELQRLELVEYPAGS